MPEGLGKMGKAKYIFLLVVLSIFYFFWAIFAGTWDYLKEKFVKK